MLRVSLYFMAANRRRQRGKKIDRRILILIAIMPTACLLALLVGMVVAWYVIPSRFVNARASDLSQEFTDEIVIMAAADFAKHHDIERAKEILAELKVPNIAQYVSLVAERMIRTNRGPVDEDIKNVVELADALGVSTVSMVAYISPPTATALPPAASPTATNTRVVVEAQAQEVAVSSADETVTEAAIAAAATAEPTATEPPTSTPAATATPLPELPTSTPLPPTATPEPTAMPKPEFDFILVKQRLLSIEENGGCIGNHNIFVDIIDATGNPLKGIQLGDIWHNPGPITGHKGDDKPGRAEYDLYKNQGLHILVKSDPSAGREVTSQVTELLSTNDWEIGIPHLIEAGYCPDEGTCRVKWNSGIFGEGNNTLCWGHYSWEVVFQRAW